MLKLTCILSFLKFVHVLIKFIQMQDIFVCHSVVAIKVYQGDLYNMCYDETSKFVVDSFWSFKFFLISNIILFTCNGYRMLI
jgi:hypothetical protein